MNPDRIYLDVLRRPGDIDSMLAQRLIYVRAVCAAACVCATSPEHINADVRFPSAVRARALLSWILVRGFGWKLKTAGAWMSRHHTTVLHHVQRVDATLAADLDTYREDLAQAIDQMLAVSRAKQ